MDEARIIPLRPGEPPPSRPDHSVAAVPHATGDPVRNRSSAIEDRVAAGLAFLRRRLTGEYDVDEFGFDMELTDEVHWYDFYDRNGTVLSSSMGKKRQGKWWIDKDQLCVDVDKEAAVRCYDVLVSGNNVQLRGDGFLPLDAVLRSPINRR